MSDSVRPHRLQPTKIPCPWDSPGKNTGLGCHFLLQCMKVKSKSEVAQSCPTLSDPIDCSLSGSPVHGIFQARVLEWIAIAFSEGSSGCAQKYRKLQPHWAQCREPFYLGLVILSRAEADGICSKDIKFHFSKAPNHSHFPPL